MTEPPVARCFTFSQMGPLTQEGVDQIRKTVEAEVAEIEQFAAECPFPEPSVLDDLLYAP